MASMAKPIISSIFLRPPASLQFKTTQKAPSLHLPRKTNSSVLRASYEVGGGYTQEELEAREKGRSKHQEAADETSTWSPAQYEALLKGGEQVTSVLEEMANLLEDDQMDEESEELAVLLAAQGVIGKRVDQMESGFMMALDYMINLAEKDQDDKVQVVGLLCRTPRKESRHELLRRVAAGGGAFESENGAKVHLPGANLNDIANQADDLLETMESRPVVPDRKLLARLVLIREEARCMMGGGLLDERNNRGLNTLRHYLDQRFVNFLTKLVAQKPGKTVREMIKNVMLGKDEGADNNDEEETRRGGKGGISGSKPNPVRPGMFLETVSKMQIVHCYL
ncbi:hypothetical protein L1887_23050 [Cichorium endivia]|nr:hypothetical protein L1887_23050 [Cichorium endivia]